MLSKISSGLVKSSKSVNFIASDDYRPLPPRRGLSLSSMILMKMDLENNNSLNTGKNKRI